MKRDLISAANLVCQIQAGSRSLALAGVAVP